jgi:hypothetical protein
MNKHNPLKFRHSPFVWTLLTLLPVTLFAGCAGMVTANDGRRVTVEHDGFVSVESARGVAIKSCQQAGKTDAAYVSSANKNPVFAAGLGVQLSTFECT